VIGKGKEKEKGKFGKEGERDWRVRDPKREKISIKPKEGKRVE